MLRSIALIGVIPLGLGSFALFHLVRSVLRLLLRLRVLVRGQKDFRWRVWSAELLREPLVLPVVMTEAPRWNVHAITASLLPLQVTDRLRVCTTDLDDSARAWTVVVYTLAANRAVETFGSVDSAGRGGWKEVILPPGRYSLTLRYYGGTDGRLPAVEIDGGLAMPAEPVSPRVNDFYSELAGRTNWFYLALQHHVHVLLQHPWLVPARLLERIFLPVGNPQTRFRYGLLPSGSSLVVRADALALEAHGVHLCLYNRASFPVRWATLTPSENNVRINPESRPLWYLLRIHQERPTREPWKDSWLVVSFEGEDKR